MKAFALILLLVATPLAAQTAFDPFHEARIDDRRGAEVPADAALVDENGRATSLRALGRGQPILLVPVLHDCPNLCGVTLAGVADAVAAQPERGFVTVAFGIDPKEGADRAAADLARLRDRKSGAALAEVHATVGAEPAVRSITQAIGYHYAWDERIGQYAHAAATAVLTPDGHLSGWLYGLTPDPAALTQAIRAARAERQASLSERLLLLCYHFDPATGRYTPAIERILRLGAATTVAALALLVFALRRRRAA